MNRDDIIRMAREAWVDNDHLDACGYTDLYKFAALVTAAERERVIAQNAPVIERISNTCKELVDTLQAAVVAEREACAKVCENAAHSESGSELAWASRACAAAIRARGEK